MRVKLLRQILALLIMVAYVGVTMLQAASGYAANPEIGHATAGGMTHDQDNPGDKMPCKGMPPGCISDLGCVFLVSLPAPDLTLVDVTASSSVSYDPASRGLHGRTIKPALGPPILLA